MCFEVTVLANGEGGEAAALGWPALSAYEAMKLAALAGGPLSSPDLRDAIDRLRADRGLRPLSRRLSPASNCTLLARGYIRSQRNGRNPTIYRITQAALDARGPHTTIVPMLGRDLEDERFAAFTRQDDELGERRRVTPLESLALLAQAVAGGGE